MPSVSQTTPTITAREQEARTRATDQRAASPKGESVTTSTWPIVTRTAYDILARGLVVPKELSDLRLRRLCEARAALGRTLTAVGNVQLDYSPKAGSASTSREVKVYNKMRSLYEKLEKELLAFPLEVR